MTTASNAKMSWVGPLPRVEGRVDGQERPGQGRGRDRDGGGSGVDGRGRDADQGGGVRILGRGPHLATEPRCAAAQLQSAQDRDRDRENEDADVGIDS